MLVNTLMIKHTWALEDFHIIDLDNGSQPMFNENKKIVITFGVVRYITIRI